VKWIVDFANMRAASHRGKRRGEWIDGG
jgi:hypothetical protein